MCACAAATDDSRAAAAPLMPWSITLSSSSSFAATPPSASVCASRPSAPSRVSSISRSVYWRRNLSAAARRSTCWAVPYIP
eukprot:6703498-Prymnesium_polylepis.2